MLFERWNCFFNQNHPLIVLRMFGFSPSYLEFIIGNLLTKAFKCIDKNVIDNGCHYLRIVRKMLKYSLI